MTAFYFNYSGWRCIVRSFKSVLVTLCLLLIFWNFENVEAQVLGDPIDVSSDFQKLENVYFVGSRIGNFDVSNGKGNLIWDRYLRSTTLSFNKIDVGLMRKRSERNFPARNTTKILRLPFSISFVDPRTIRLSFNSRANDFGDGISLMLAGGVTEKR